MPTMRARHGCFGVSLPLMKYSYPNFYRIRKAPAMHLTRPFSQIKSLPRLGGSARPAVEAILSDKVLVLNRSWVAVNVATVRRALTLVYQDVARIVAPDDYSTYDFEGW